MNTQSSVNAGTVTAAGRFSHAGAAGALRHLVVDDVGNCAQFKKYGNCRRQECGRCTFRHGSQQALTPARNATAVMTPEQHRQIVEYAGATGKDPSTVTIEPIEEVQAAPPVARAQRKPSHFAVLHSGPRSRRQRAQPQVEFDLPETHDWDGCGGEELELDWAEQ